MASSIDNPPHWSRNNELHPLPSTRYSLQGLQSWWHGHASFKGTVLVPSCLIKMDNSWQLVTTARQKIPSHNDQYEASLKMMLEDCDINNYSKHINSGAVVNIIVESNENTEKYVLTNKQPLIDYSNIYPEVKYNPYKKSIDENYNSIPIGYLLKFTEINHKSNSKQSIYTLGITIIHE